jgi:hypothetical protein
MALKLSITARFCNATYPIKRLNFIKLSANLLKNTPQINEIHKYPLVDEIYYDLNSFKSRANEDKILQPDKLFSLFSNRNIRYRALQ